jgi:hypothetical protein
MKPITFPTNTSMHPEQCPLKPSYAIKTHVSGGTKCSSYFIHPWGGGGGGLNWGAITGN